LVYRAMLHHTVSPFRVVGVCLDASLFSLSAYSVCWARGDSNPLPCFWLPSGMHPFRHRNTRSGDQTGVAVGYDWPMICQRGIEPRRVRHSKANTPGRAASSTFAPDT